MKRSGSKDQTTSKTNNKTAKRTTEVIMNISFVCLFRLDLNIKNIVNGIYNTVNGFEKTDKRKTGIDNCHLLKIMYKDRR